MTNPSLLFHKELDNYQKWVGKLLANSTNDNGTVGNTGLSPLAYCYNGVIEETQELVEKPTETASYNRLLSLLGQTSEEAPQLEIERHQKEFGDVLWYGAACMELLGVRLSSLIYNNGHADLWIGNSIVEHDPKTSAGIQVINAANEMRIGAIGMFAQRPVYIMGEGITIHDPNELRSRGILAPKNESIFPRQTLVSGTKKFIAASAEVLPINFDITLEEVLRQNIRKIEKRAIENTIYKSASVHGNDR